tara:strand:+ start:295 stop:1662 length:1368 start_codon:yes stop_codon:yes gene_type:complete
MQTKLIEQIKGWTPSSWKNYNINQQPEWPNLDKYNDIINKLSKMPQLISGGEIVQLKNRLKEVEKGESFILQGGDCAETFTNFKSNIIKDQLKILLQMASVISYGASTNILKIGRIAGQFAKPRTNDFEIINGKKCYTYRGDAVNSIKQDYLSRIPDPERLLVAYNHSVGTLNLIRGFIEGGFTDISLAKEWNLEFMKNSDQGKKYQELSNKIIESINFIKAIQNEDNINTKLKKFNEFYISHEGLLLDYEQALTRYDSASSKWYASSSHMLWVGNRTNSIDGAHVEFLSGVANPIGVKIGPGTNPDYLIDLVMKLNPLGEHGKIILIIRIGADRIDKELPFLINAVASTALPVIWVCDPMHGNTFKTDEGIKTRDFNTILKEIKAFFRIHYSLGTIPGGIHFELTGENVTECIGGSKNISTTELKKRYETACDPRMNNDQSLEMAFLVNQLLTK